MQPRAPRAFKVPRPNEVEKLATGGGRSTPRRISRGAQRRSRTCETPGARARAQVATEPSPVARACFVSDETELQRNDMVFGFRIETRFSVG